MSEFDDLVAELKRARDEIVLHIHLASMEAREEWDDLEGKWRDFTARADLEESAEGVGRALKQLGTELGQAYDRFRKALRE